MAYALFETDWIIPHGVIRKTDTPMMAMVKETATGVLLSLADPDLRLPKRRNMGYLDHEAMETPARPSLVRVELRGRWTAEAIPENMSIRETGHGVTVLECRCEYGLTSEIALTGGV
jgi:hypothetical protein